MGRARDSSKLRLAATRGGTIGARSTTGSTLKRRQNFVRWISSNDVSRVPLLTLVAVSMEPAAQETLHEVTPTVELCLSELSYEVERCFAELGSEAWDLNPVQFLAMALKRHNPRRGKAALTSATAAAETDVYVKPKRSAPGGGDSANADSRMMRPAVVEGGFTFAEAALVERRIEEGAVYADGARLPLIERRGDVVVVTVPQPPPALDPVEANLQALEAARGRVASAMAPVLGAELPPLPPPPSAGEQLSLPLGQLAEWLHEARYTALEMPASFAEGLRMQFVARTYLNPKFVEGMLAGSGPEIEFLGAQLLGSEYEAHVVAKTLLARADELQSLRGVHAALLESPQVAEALGGLAGLEVLALAPGVGTKVNI